MDPSSMTFVPGASSPSISSSRGRQAGSKFRYKAARTPPRFLRQAEKWDYDPQRLNANPESHFTQSLQPAEILGYSPQHLSVSPEPHYAQPFSPQVFYPPARGGNAFDGVPMATRHYHNVQTPMSFEATDHPLNWHITSPTSAQLRSTLSSPDMKPGIVGSRSLAPSGQCMDSCLSYQTSHSTKGPTVYPPTSVSKEGGRTSLVRTHQPVYPSSADFLKTPASGLPAVFPSPIWPTPNLLGDPSLDGKTQPAPRRQILLPEVRRSSLSTPHSYHSSTSRTTEVQPLSDQDSYIFDIEAVFRKDSSPLSRRTFPATNISSLASLPQEQEHGDLDSVNDLSDEFAFVALDTGEQEHGYLDSVNDLSDEFAFVAMDTGVPPSSSLSSDINPELRNFFANLARRFGCCLNYHTFRNVMDQQLAQNPFPSYDYRKDDDYKRQIRSCAIATTGMTIFEGIVEAVTTANLSKNHHCSLSYFWFLLLVREVLVYNAYAKDSGTLITLHARDVNPCHSSFRFLSLERAICQLLQELNHRMPRITCYGLSFEQRVPGKCEKGHLQITIESVERTSSLPRAELDHIEYTNELRMCFLKIVNQTDCFAGFTCFVLLTFLGQKF
ncbi:hypothetical protein AN958_04269 [Leucoagaricus sp. SymC.cos]|nr:hypothetical protein AN958_04269 [Leucoagaricus sp. SymC.cos]